MSDRVPRAREGEAGSQREDVISRWEWVAGAVGALVVAIALWVLVTDALAPSTPPDVRVTADTIDHQGATRYRVAFTARNLGTEAAAGVVVEGMLVRPAGDTLRATATLDYVSGESRRSGGLFFDADPRAGELTLRAVGYTEP